MIKAFLYCLYCLSLILPLETKLTNQPKNVRKLYPNKPQIHTDLDDDDLGKNMIPIKTWRESDRLVFQCTSENIRPINVNQVQWFLHNLTQNTAIRGLADFRIIKDRLVMLHPDNYNGLNVSCIVDLKNGTKLTGKHITIVPLSLDPILNDIGTCVDYDELGICLRIEGFPRRIFLHEGSKMSELESEIIGIMNIYLNFSARYNIVNDCVLPLLCFSQYSFCNGATNSSIRIHQEDLANIIREVQSFDHPIPDEVVRGALLVYQRNQESIYFKTGDDSIRYRPKKRKISRTFDCQEGNGESYAGTLNRTFSGKPCLSWMSISLTIQLFPMSLYDMNHNFCRNPGGHEDGTYCYVEEDIFEMCELPACKKKFLSFNIDDMFIFFKGFMIAIMIVMVLVALFLIYQYNSELYRFYHDMKFRRHSVPKTPPDDSDNNVVSIRNLDILTGKPEPDNIPAKTLKKGEQNVDSVKDSETGSGLNIIFTTRSLISILHFNLSTNRSDITRKNKGVPYITGDYINITALDLGGSYIGVGTFNTEKAKAILGKIHPKSYLLLNEPCIVVASEGTWDVVKDRYSRLQHVNLHRIIGAVADKEMSIPSFLIYEPASLGDIGSYLRTLSHKTKAAKYSYLINFIKQVSQGLNFLQARSVVHGDISLRNIALCPSSSNPSTQIVKITDYAKFRPIHSDDYMFFKNEDFIDNSGFERLGLYLPIKWMAPELVQAIIYSKDLTNISVSVPCDITVSTLSNVPGTLSSDVYSFGIMAWELFNYGKKPFENYDMHQFIILTLNNSIPDLNSLGLEDCVSRLVTMCTQRNVSRRYTSCSIMTHVNKLRESIDTKIINPKVCTAVPS